MKIEIKKRRGMEKQLERGAIEKKKKKQREASMII